MELLITMLGLLNKLMLLGKWTYLVGYVAVVVIVGVAGWIFLAVAAPIIYVGARVGKT